MVAKRIIPCLDVADGRVVKGVNFVGLRDAGDPVELACRYSASGADELVFLDIAASHQGRDTLVDLVRRTAEAVTIPFTVGGGISSVEGITELLRAGADKVSLNSSAVRDPQLVARVRVTSDKLGYVPDPAARALASQRSDHMAILIPLLSNALFVDLLESAQATCARRGFRP